jgi:hypothetical protein
VNREPWAAEPAHRQLGHDRPCALDLPGQSNTMSAMRFEPGPNRKKMGRMFPYSAEEL